MTEQSELAASELEVARSIYGPDWYDVPPKKTAWGTAQETGWWEVKLRTEDGRVSVGLRGRITKHYPKQPPPLQLVDPVMLSPAHVQALSKHLQELAKTLVGNDMIFDLAEATREWITNNHMPLPKPGSEVPTLMEEMARREEAQRAAEAAQKELEQQSRLAQAAEQNRLLDERIQLDASRKEERARQVLLDEAEKYRLESISSLSDGELESRELHLDHPISIEGFDGTFSSWILFCGRKENLWTSYTAEPIGTDGTVNTEFVRASLPSVTVQVIDFSKSYYLTAQGKKKVDSLATEIGRLRDIKHENVLKVYGVKRDKSPKGWERLIVLVERVDDGGKLKSWLGRDGVGEETARDYLSQILSGLAELHKNNITQKQLDPESVVIASSVVKSTILAKLCNIGYARRIIEYHRSNPFLKSYEDTIPDSWLSPDEIDSPYSHSKPRDIWHAGLLMLQMLFGQNCLLAYPSLNTLLQHAPGGISESLTELLGGLLHPLYRKRLTAEEGLRKLKAEDEVTTIAGRNVRIPFGGRSAPSPGFPSPQDLFGRSPIAARGLASYFPNSAPAYGTLQSRYRTDFEEVEFLGKGGFGEVVKARNKLDGRSYAIKKVKLRPEDNEQKVYREVNSLSRVSHQYIVRYYGCWLEDTGRIEPTPSEVTSGLTQSKISEEDIFATNFDDLSVSHRDHSRSASSFPRIRFANSGESDEEEENSDDDDSDQSDSSEGGETAADPSEARDAAMHVVRGRPISVFNKPSLSLTDGTTDDGGVQRILYIQMEFVEKQTLREAITSGLSEEESWRLLLQILQALAHMSSLGIVHRDLKPSNILLDASGNVKIADFGLSTTDMTALETGVNLANSADFSDQTSGIGTSLYIAPEVSISRSYNEKADMYSLGVIFFEMCYPFRTSMERAQILTALRQPSITFPVGWPIGQNPNQRETITWLLRHDPTLRPQATQLLASSLLPSPEKQKEFYESAIMELTNPKSSQYPALLEALFTSSPTHTFSTSTDNRLEDYTYDNNNEHDHELQIWLTIVIQRLVDLLQRHGAVDDYLPLLIPETTLLSAFPDLSPVRMLDQSGKIVQLPSSDLLGLARSATRRQIERIKRYHVGRRYVDHPAGGQPRVTGELSFDIVSPIRSSAAEAELLEIVDKVISEFHGDRGNSPSDYDFHVSHESVLATILSAVPDRSRSSVLKAFKAIGSGMGIAQAKALLGGVTGLSKQLRDDLEDCCTASEFDEMRAKLESMFTSSRRRLGAVLDEMANIVKLARACGVNRKILFRPILSRNAEFFRGGFMFECVRRGKQRDVVAFGGRYDSLLEHFKEPAQQMQSRRVFGAGMSIAVDQLARMVRKYESSLSTRLMTKENEDERSFGFWSPARCDVYVAAVAQVDLSARLSVIGELWRAGIRADLQYDDERSLDEVQLECLEQNTLFLVIPRANRPIVKVRSVLKRSEEEVPRNELCNWLRMAILEQRRIDASYASAEGSIPSSLSLQSTTMTSGESRQAEAADIRLVLPPDPVSNKPTKTKPVRKHRHVTKSVFYDKANDFATSIKTSLPIYGLDLPTPFISALCLDASWINDDEAWRSMLQTGNIQGSERKYCEMVRECLGDFKARSNTAGGGGAGGSAGGGNCWLFSVREGRGFLLQLK